MIEEGICCICGNIYRHFGNNPEGAVWKDEDGNIVFGEFESEDRCCDVCDSRYVIPGRIYRSAKLKEERENGKQN